MVFSLLNNLYTKERNQMAFDLIKTELMIRLNFAINCVSFKSTTKKSKLMDDVIPNAQIQDLFL